MKVLLTGGAGYIGSHTALQLLERGHQVEIVDNFSTGHRTNIDIIDVPCYEFDIQNTKLLKELLLKKQFDVLIHFAGSTYVAESFQVPEKYYQNNIVSSISLLEAVKAMESPAKMHP